MIGMLLNNVPDQVLKSTRKRITEKYNGFRDHRMVACCMAFVSFVLTVKLLLSFLKRSSVI